MPPHPLRKGTPSRRQPTSRPRLERLETRTLLAAGSLDTLLFGTKGVATAGFQGTVEATALAATTQPDGAVLVLGQVPAPIPAATSPFKLVRTLPGGAADPSFGAAGQLFLGVNLQSAAGVAVQGDGKIVVVGGKAGSLAVARLNADGSPDPAFGSGGLVVTSLAPSVQGGIPPSGTARTALLQPDGKLLVVGVAATASYGWGFNILGYTYQTALARYNADGSLDTGFGTGGTVVLPSLSDPSGEPAGAALQSDGKIVVLTDRLDSGFDDLFGHTSAPRLAHTLVRLNSNGSPDTTFGSGGKTVVDFGSALTNVSGKGLVIQADGRIVELVSGTTSSGSTTTPVYGLARVTSAGALDPSFGNGGTVVSTIGSVAPAGLRLEGDGKILVAANGDHQFVLARYTADGAVDNSFGSGGVALRTLPGPDGRVVDLTLEAGKPVLVGTVQPPGAYHDVALARYDLDGTPDASYGTGGLVLTELQGLTNDTATALAVQGDGKILEVGNNGLDFALARYTADGSLDTTFGGGTVTTDFGDTPDQATRVALQDDGKVLVAGTSAASPGVVVFALARYNPDGSIDVSFGTGGKTTLSFQNGVDTVAGVLPLPGGQILVGGSSAAPNSTHTDLVLARLQPNGMLDASFGTSGKVISHTPFSITAAALALQADGKVLVAGTAEPGAVSLTRFNADGSLDTTFGAGNAAGPGHVSTSIGGPEPDGATAVVVQADGKIVVGGLIGHTDPSASPSHLVDALGLLRYNPDGSLDPGFGTAGIAEQDYTVQTVQVVLQEDGKIDVLGGLSRPHPGTSTSYIGRYNANGTPDSSFGTRGFFWPVPDPSTALALGADGNLLVGTTRSASSLGSPTADMAVERYLAQPDPIHYVAQLYVDLLQRPADASGLHFWVDRLNGGLSHQGLVTAFLQSDEYRAVVLRGFYSNYLRRDADAAGLGYWLAVLRGGATTNQLRVLFLASDEFFQARGGGTTDGYLNALYFSVLFRPVDGSGQAAFGPFLAAGGSRLAVAAALATSRERAGAFVDVSYVLLLRRGVDDVGRNFFVPALQHGATDEDVLGALAASDEYYNSW